MTEWHRGTLSVLALYACFQLFVWSFVLSSSPLAAPTRGDSAQSCAATSFSAEGVAVRSSLFDPSALIVGSTVSGSRMVNGGEEVFRQLSLVREATRDAWVHFGGDLSLKNTFWSFGSILSRLGPSPPLTTKETRKRQANRASLKQEQNRIGSTKVTFNLRPLLSDVTKDWSKLTSIGPAQPGLVIYSAGMWDAVNNTAGALNMVDTLVSTIYTSMVTRISSAPIATQGGEVAIAGAAAVPVIAGQSTVKKLPTVVFLSSPRSAAPTTTALSHEASERLQQITERLKDAVRIASLKLARLEPNPSSSTAAAAAGAESTTSLEKTISHHIVFIDVDALTALSQQTSEVVAATSAVSLAAFASCHLGQPSWALAAFTPAQSWPLFYRNTVIDKDR